MKKIYTPDEMVFRRKFAVNLYKNLRFPLGEMSLYAHWLDSERGDPYQFTSRVMRAMYSAYRFAKGAVFQTDMAKE